jgi:hypothetical protein
MTTIGFIGSGKIGSQLARLAVAAADLAVVTIPFKAIDSVSVEPLAGKIVIDTNNYYDIRDGHIADLDDESTTVSEALQRHLPTSKVVKAFNHIQFSALTTEGQPSGTPGRRALVAIGDDPDAVAVVAQLIDSFGFDPVAVSPLSEGWRIQKDTPGYGPRLTADELRTALAEATRHRDV